MKRNDRRATTGRETEGRESGRDHRHRMYAEDGRTFDKAPMAHGNCTSHAESCGAASEGIQMSPERSANVNSGRAKRMWNADPESSAWKRLFFLRVGSHFLLLPIDAIAVPDGQCCSRLRFDHDADASEQCIRNRWVRVRIDHALKVADQRQPRRDGRRVRGLDVDLSVTDRPPRRWAASCVQPHGRPR